MNDSTSDYWKTNDEYHERQGEVGSVESNIEFFSKILTTPIGPDPLADVYSVLELGAGEGRNIAALQSIDSRLKLMAVELNPEAASKIPQGEVYIGNAFDNPFTADLVLTKGLIIHIPPERQVELFDVIYKASNKHILLCEYYSPKIEEIEYRGEMGRLWKGDYAGDMMDLYPDLKLVDYGFTYYRDEFPQDSITWFLLEKEK